MLYAICALIAVVLVVSCGAALAHDLRSYETRVSIGDR